MKITNSPAAPKPVTISGAAGPARAGGTGQPASTAGAGSPGVDQAARLTQLESQLAPSDFSAAKVSEISSAIAAGRYTVNAGAVADKLLASTAELSRKSAGNNQ